jgi:hypothetical protein
LTLKSFAKALNFPITLQFVRQAASVAGCKDDVHIVLDLDLTLERKINDTTD